VRFDILERLADQIRPALFWKEGVEARPDAAFGKGAFFVTPGMMSILGATHDDMATVLGGLGYRGQPMPKAEFDAKLEAAKLIVPAQAAAPDAPKFEVVIASPHRIDVQDKAEQDKTEPAAADEAEAAPAAADDSAADAVDVVPPVAEQPVPDTVVSAAAEAAEEPKPVMVWRVARADRPERAAPRGRPMGNRAAPDAKAADGEAKSNGRPNGGKPRFDRSRFQKPKGEEGAVAPADGAAAGEGAAAQQRRFDRPRQDRPNNDRAAHGKSDGGKADGGKSDGKPRFDKRNGDKPRFDQAGASQRADKPRVEKPIDPDSPFAKLAALKERMKG
jgi:ATP-dependent RNA helicase SUPV3L1/SUV3